MKKPKICPTCNENVSMSGFIVLYASDAKEDGTYQVPNMPLYECKSCRRIYNLRELNNSVD